MSWTKAFLAVESLLPGERKARPPDSSGATDDKFAAQMALSNVGNLTDSVGGSRTMVIRRSRAYSSRVVAPHLATLKGQSAYYTKAN